MEILPENSTTALEYDESTTRFSSASWYEEAKKTDITIVGVGGIGSHTVFNLSRIHPSSIVMYDGDTVERVNMAGQFYNDHSIGMSKAHAIGCIIREFSGYNNYRAYNLNIQENYVFPLTRITICGLDNMEARKIVFNKWKDHITGGITPENIIKECLFIDGRLSAEELQIYAIKGDDPYAIEKYEKECLFDDSSAEHTLCSYKQTTYCASMIGSMITNIIVNHLSNIANNSPQDPLLGRPVPFYTYYDASLMYFKTEL